MKNKYLTTIAKKLANLHKTHFALDLLFCRAKLFPGKLSAKKIKLMSHIIQSIDKKIEKNESYELKTDNDLKKLCGWTTDDEVNTLRTSKYLFDSVTGKVLNTAFQFSEDSELNYLNKNSICRNIVAFYLNKPENGQFILEFIKTANHDLFPFTTFKYTNGYTHTLLSLASSYGHVEVVKSLLSYKPDPEVSSSLNEALRCALNASYKLNTENRDIYSEVIMLLLEKISPEEMANFDTHDGYSPALFYFLKHQNIALSHNSKIVEKFIEKMTLHHLCLVINGRHYNNREYRESIYSLIFKSNCNEEVKAKLLTLLHNKCYPVGKISASAASAAAKK